MTSGQIEALKTHIRTLTTEEQAKSVMAFIETLPTEDRKTVWSVAVGVLCNCLHHLATGS